MSRLLLCTACMIAVIGMFVLFVTKPAVAPNELILHGYVKEVRTKGSATFIEFTPTNLLVMSFDKTPPKGNVSLVGTLQQYKGKVEFVVSDVR